MSGQPPTFKRGKWQTGTDGGEGSGGGRRVKVYLYGVTVEAAALLEDTGNRQLLQNVNKESRADVAFDPNPSPVPGMKILIIRGLPKQIEKAVSLISEAIGTKETISTQAQTFWLQWVQAAFPDLDSRAYFLPPVYLHRVPMTRQSVGGQDVRVLQVAEGQAGQSNHLSSSAQSDEYFQPTLPENVDEDIQQTSSGRSGCCIQLTPPELSNDFIYLTSLEESSQNIQTTSPGQLSQSTHPTPLASQYIQQISPKQGGQILQSKSPEQDGQCTTALRQDSQHILLRQPSQIGQTSDQQADQYVWSPPGQAGQNIQTGDAGQYIQSITFGRSGQCIQPTSPGKAGQDIEITTPRQFGRCIQPISPQHVDQYIQPPGQAGQKIQPASHGVVSQCTQSTLDGQAAMYIQPALPEKVVQDMQSAAPGQISSCVQLIQYLLASHSSGQESQLIHPSPLGLTSQYLQQAVLEQGDEDIQPTSSEAYSPYILTGSPEAYIQAPYSVQASEVVKTVPFTQSSHCIQPMSSAQICQHTPSTSHEQGGHSFPHSQVQVNQYIQQILSRQDDQYIQLPPGHVSNNICQKICEQTGQYSLNRQSEQAGQFIQITSRWHANHCIEPTSSMQTSQNVHAGQVTKYNNLTSSGQVGQFNHLTSSAQSYQLQQQTSYRQLDQFIQPTSIEQPNQYIHPSRQVCEDIQPPPYEEAVHCVQLNPVENVGPYIQLPPYQQADQYLQPTLFQQTDQYTPSLPFGRVDQSSQLKHHEKPCQDIHQTYQQSGQVIQSTPAEQSGLYIQPTATEMVGQYIQPPQHRLTCELNWSTEFQESSQSNQSTPLKNADQCLQPAMVSSSAQSLNPQPTRVQDSDVRDDAAMQRVLVCLQSMAEVNGEIMFVLSQLQLGQYLGEPCYSPAAAQFSLPNNLVNSSPNDEEGTFDALLIHRQYGFVACDVKSFGDNLYQLSMPQVTINTIIRNKLKDSVSQLNKAEAMLSHLVSDIAPGLRITKTIAFPNLTTDQVQQAICEDIPLTEDLCRCLGTSDPADITGLCLCCDQLSDPETPCDVSSHVLRELGHWWHRRVAGAGPDSHMTYVVYKMLVARFCGPATTVSVPCTCPPRVSVKTLGQAVWWTGECYTAVITLFPEQVHLLHTAPPTLFVTGPPGTGKTVVLLLMAIQWLRCGHNVYVVSTWMGSRAASIMLYHLLLQTVKKQLEPEVLVSQLHLLHVDLNGNESVEKAVNDLSQAASGGSLYVLIDEMGHEDTSFMEAPKMKYIQRFCEKLLTQVPRLHLWAASCYHKNCPPSWRVEYLTRPLRSPPSVVREVKKHTTITKGHIIKKYSERGVSDHTDGPPVTRLYHRGQGHSGGWPGDCVTCGREVASFLHSLRVGVTENNERTTVNTVTSTTGGTTPCLQWRDVLVLHWDYYMYSGMVTGLQEAGIPVRVMKDEDIEDVATARSDVVWVTSADSVRGLERKVVVCLQYDYRSLYDDVTKSEASRRVAPFRSDSFHSISRCTSQLVIVEKPLST